MIGNAFAVEGMIEEKDMRSGVSLVVLSSCRINIIRTVVTHTVNRKPSFTHFLFCLLLFWAETRPCFVWRLTFVSGARPFFSG